MLFLLILLIAVRRCLGLALSIQGFGRAGFARHYIIRLAEAVVHGTSIWSRRKQRVPSIPKPQNVTPQNAGLPSRYLQAEPELEKLGACCMEHWASKQPKSLI